jgi:hypothetical protein
MYGTLRDGTRRGLSDTERILLREGNREGTRRGLSGLGSGGAGGDSQSSCSGPSSSIPDALSELPEDVRAAANYARELLTGRGGSVELMVRHAYSPITAPLPTVDGAAGNLSASSAPSASSLPPGSLLEQLRLLQAGAGAGAALGTAPYPGSPLGGSSGAIGTLTLSAADRLPNLATGGERAGGLRKVLAAYAERPLEAASFDALVAGISVPSLASALQWRLRMPWGGALDAIGGALEEDEAEYVDPFEGIPFDTERVAADEAERNPAHERLEEEALRLLVAKLVANLSGKRQRGKAENLFLTCEELLRLFDEMPPELPPLPSLPDVPLEDDADSASAATTVHMGAPTPAAGVRVLTEQNGDATSSAAAHVSKPLNTAPVPKPAPAQAEMEVPEAAPVETAAELVMERRETLARSSEAREAHEARRRIAAAEWHRHILAERAQLFVSEHGLLPLVHELSEASESTAALLGLLRLLNAVLRHGGPAVCEQACLIGVVPAALSFFDLLQPQSLRLQAAILSHTLCTGSALPLQMFIACNGPPALVALLVNPSSAREIVIRAIDAIKAVLDLRSSRTPRNDLCRTFVEHEILELLLPAIIDINAEYPRHADRGAEVVLQLSSADTAVKTRMATRKVLPGLMQLLAAPDEFAPELQVKILRTIKHLCMGEASYMDELQRAKAIPHLIGLLRLQRGGPHFAEMRNQCVNTLYLLCRINRSRQEAAAIDGALPMLQEIIEQASPLKQFALPIMCDIAKASKRARAELKQYNGVQFYLGLLSVSYWQVRNDVS